MDRFEELRTFVAVADLDEAEAVVRDERQALGGILRVGAPLSFGLVRSMPILNAFMHDHPALRLELDLDDRKVDLVTHRLDLAVRTRALIDHLVSAFDDEPGRADGHASDQRR